MFGVGLNVVVLGNQELILEELVSVPETKICY